jgi:hypothetical protein
VKPLKLACALEGGDFADAWGKTPAFVTADCLEVCQTMNATNLITNLQARGVRLAVEGDRLVWWPPEQVGPDLERTLRQNEGQLLEALRRVPHLADARPPAETPAVGPVEAAGLSFPLSWADELVLEKQILRKLAASCANADLRLRAKALAAEQPGTLAEAMAWHKRELALEGELRGRRQPE